MTVYLAWADEPFDPALDSETDGPWRELRRIDDHLLLVESSETLSRVYHHLKWTFEAAPTLLVTPVTDTPKSRGLPPGTTTWLRHHT
ncbi:hypothetical protein [Nocardioides bruguierae]|uniref:hypothetical protein n=1 Tax=Nocardioides bruguierae TaxID=2945102 RepID=UPI00202008E0|nr:hypothetical protein [Nocardioides bruguierae]MCL8026973.1 hypothetical protein [Nocardioides bruguierae]